MNPVYKIAPEITVAAASSVVSVVAAEYSFLGIPESVLLVAVAGSAFGAWLSIGSSATLKGKGDSQPTKKIFKWGAFFLAVVVWGIIAAWLTLIVHPLTGSGLPLLPLAGVCGVSIRAVTPKLLGSVERIIDRIGNHSGSY